MSAMAKTPPIAIDRKVPRPKEEMADDLVLVVEAAAAVPVGLVPDPVAVIVLGAEGTNVVAAVVPLWQAVDSLSVLHLRVAKAKKNGAELTRDGSRETGSGCRSLAVDR